MTVPVAEPRRSPLPGTEPAPRHPETEVLHAVAGRVRLRVPLIAADAAYADTLAELARSEHGVVGVRVNRAAASIAVRYRPSLGDAALRKRLEEHVRSARDPALARGREGDRPGVGEGRWRLGLPAITAGLALLGGPLGFAVPAPLIAGAVAAAALPIARRAIYSVRVERKLNIDVLDMTAIVLTTLRGSYLAPAVMISLVEIGEAIRERTARASRREALDLLGSMAHSVWLERGGDRQRVPIERVTAGDTVVVYPGDRIPVDGRILDGRGLIDAHQLTGEAMPVLREEGQRVYASTLMREGHLHIGVEQVGDETRAGRIIRLMQDAPVHDTRIEDYAAKVADRAVLPAFLLSGAVLLATRNPARAASILITDLMTGIRVSVPTTVLAALTSAARQGILIRSGRALEQLAGVDVVVFDKTGTLTRGEPTVAAVEAVDDAMSPAEVLTLAATAEQRLTHPVAEAVVRYARERGVSPGRRHGWRYEIGLGVRATIEARTVLVGSDRLLEREGIDLDRLPALAAGGGSRIYVAADGRVCGAMTYLDPPRPEGEAVVAALSQSLGIEVHMLTGDKSQAARAVADATGIDRENTHAELFPEEKARVVRELRAAGRTVAFVGDGVNDLPALAYADVSVSFGGATDVARETADVVLMDDDLRGLPHAIAAGRNALRLIRQNIGIVAGTNLGALGLAAVGSLGPVAAALIHNGSTIVAGANGLRPLAGRRGPAAARPSARGAEGL